MERYMQACLQAADVLPPVFRESAGAYMKENLEEFRLRVGKPMAVVVGDTERMTDSPRVREEDLRTILERASRASAHTVLEQVLSGYVTIRGGHRIGICGEAVMKNGQVHALRRLTSVAIRIARPVPGAAQMVIPRITEQGVLCDTLILAPPGVGKTTLLREIVRCVSDGIGLQAQRVGVADERREISALWEGQAQFDLGRQTDVMADCPKAAAMEILLRGMNPQILAADEITSQRDTEAMLWAAGCGATLLATAHGTGLDDLERRPLYRRLLELKLFRRVVLIRNHCGIRSSTVEVIG